MKGRTREKLSKKLHEIAENVYYQPTGNSTLKFPCIAYSKNYTDAVMANNNAYIVNRSYDVQFMSIKASDTIEDSMYDAFDNVKLTNNFIADGVYHEQYRVYF